MTRKETLRLARIILEVSELGEGEVPRNKIRDAWACKYPEDDRPRGNRKLRGLGPGSRVTDCIRVGLVELERDEAIIRRDTSIRVLNWPFLRNLANRRDQ